VREIRFRDWLAYCYAELSHLRFAKYRISIARVYLSLLDAAGVYASDVRLTLAHPLIERDSAGRTPGAEGGGHEKWEGDQQERGGREGGKISGAR